MNCTTAQRLIDRGVEPGSATPMRAQLGFHLAQCAECRAYQAHSHVHLLASLLGAEAGPAVMPVEPAPPLIDSPPSIPAILPRRAKRIPARPRSLPHFAMLAAGVVVAVLLFLFVLPAASALFRIQQNVQAYIVPTAPTKPTNAGLAPVAAVMPTPAPQRPAPTAARALAGLTTASAAPTTAAQGIVPTPTARIVPTQTITPVPLDTILAASRPNPPQSGNTAGRGTLSAPATSQGGALTVLLMGVDRRPGEGNGTRADTIMVARLDPARGRIAMVSLPRDLVVPIPDFGYARINAANAYGELNNGPGGGVALTRKTLSNLLGTPIDYAVEIDFQGFIGAIDAIGGVDIDVPSEIYDPEYPTMDYGYTVAHFLPGTEHMNGERALMYARTRHADSDFSRIRRQQQVLVAVLGRVRQQNTLQQLQSVADVTGAMRGYVQTDMPEDKMINLAWTFRTTAPNSVERYSLDENSIQLGAIPGDYYALLAVPGAIEQLAHQLINGPAQ